MNFKKKRLLFLLVAGCLFTISSRATSIDSLPAKDTLKFYDAQQFAVIGKFHRENNYNRFPQNYKDKLRSEVWGLSQNAAGVAVRFRSNATAISAKWTLMGNVSLPHMAATGVKGVDLYVNVNGHWQFIQAGRPTDKASEYKLFEQDKPVYREYLLNLPLYDGVTDLAIGVNQDADISAPKESFLLNKKPVVYYGSSIAQGACASRPGMAFTNILERKMDRVFINMGFSGSGTFDAPVGEGMCETDAALFVVDCNPNTQAAVIYDRAVALVRQLKQCRPNIPVLLVENFMFEKAFFFQKDKDDQLTKQKELKRAFATLQQLGIKQLFYLEGAGLVGNDHEGTVDGVHPNDMGMMRMADGLFPTINKILVETNR